MTENKRFTIDKDGITVIDNYTDGLTECKYSQEAKLLCYFLNEITDENEQLKQELKIYRKVANCGNCHYHNYDWFDDGDEFEVCDKGNDMSDRICEEWEELE